MQGTAKAWPLWTGTNVRIPLFPVLAMHKYFM